MRPPPGGRRIFRILCITGFEKSESQIRNPPGRDERCQPIPAAAEYPGHRRARARAARTAPAVVGRQRLDPAGSISTPQKVAIRYVADGNPESPVVTVTYRRAEAAARPRPRTCSIRSASGRTTPCSICCRPSPQLYTVMLGALAAGVSPAASTGCWSRDIGRR